VELREMEERWRKAAAEADELRNRLGVLDREVKAKLERENEEYRRRLQDY
jgi:hypothetical protein